MVSIKNMFSKSKKVEPKSFQEWLGIKEILNGKILLTNNRSIYILKVLPINFKLKSELEQNSILMHYKSFLTNLDSKIQIIISSHKTDVSSHVEIVSKVTKENPKIKDAVNDYIDLVYSIVNQQGAITKDFYIAIEASTNIENEVMKVKEALIQCGNESVIPSIQEIEELIRTYINKRVQNIIGGVQ